MRTPFVLLVALVMTLVLGPTVLIAKLLGVKEGKRSIYVWAMRTWARTVCASAGARIHIHGGERMTALNTVYIANHVSWFDVLALAAVLPRYSFIAKAELRRIPLFGYAAEAAGIVFLDRDNRKAAFESYEIAAKEVQRGRPVVICPEGTRGRDYALRPFKKGPFVLAIASQAPITPTIVYGAREVMRKGSFAIHSGDVHIHFLEPIETTGLDYDDRADLMTRVWTRMANAFRELYGIGSGERPIAEVGERTG